MAKKTWHQGEMRTQKYIDAYQAGWKNPWDSQPTEDDEHYEERFAFEKGQTHRRQCDCLDGTF